MVLNPRRYVFGAALLGLTLIISLAVPTWGVAAKMSQADTESVSISFLNAMLNNNAIDQYCTKDLTVSVVESGQTINGADSARLAFADILHAGQLQNARISIDSLLVTEGRSSAEVSVNGLISDNQGNAAATGLVFEASYSVFLNLDAGKVTTVRIYGLDYRLPAPSQ